MDVGNELLSVWIVVVKIGVLLIEANHLIKGIVWVEVTVVIVVVKDRLRLLHWVIKKLALKSFFSSLIISIRLLIASVSGDRTP